jgi:hypothetical protein
VDRHNAPNRLETSNVSLHRIEAHFRIDADGFASSQ